MHTSARVSHNKLPSGLAPYLSTQKNHSSPSHLENLLEILPWATEVASAGKIEKSDSLLNKKNNVWLHKIRNIPSRTSSSEPRIPKSGRTILFLPAQGRGRIGPAAGHLKNWIYLVHRRSPIRAARKAAAVLEFVYQTKSFRACVFSNLSEPRCRLYQHRLRKT